MNDNNPGDTPDVDPSQPHVEDVPTLDDDGNASFGDDGRMQTEPVGVYNPVMVEVETLYGMSLALSGPPGDGEGGEVANMNRWTDAVMAKLSPKSPSNGRMTNEHSDADVANPGDEGDELIGSDPRYEGVQSLISWHTYAREDARRTLIAFKLGVQRMAKITNRVVAEFTSQDELNSVSVERFGELTGIWPEGHENYVSPEDREMEDDAEMQAEYANYNIKGGGGGPTAMPI